MNTKSNSEALPPTAGSASFSPDLLDVVNLTIETQERYYGDATSLHIKMIALAERMRDIVARIHRQNDNNPATCGEAAKPKQ